MHKNIQIQKVQNIIDGLKQKLVTDQLTSDVLSLGMLNIEMQLNQLDQMLEHSTLDSDMMEPERRAS